MSQRNICPACLSERVSHIFFKENYDIWRCDKCGTMFVHDVPEPDVLEEIYACKDYYEISVESEYRIQKENQRRLNAIRKYKSHGTFLDIGCARGLLLDDAKSAGFSTCGIELSRANVKICRDKGHHVFHGYLGEFLENKPVEGYDVITCLDVIEHVEEPVDFMVQAASLLKDDGLLVVSTPNYSGVIARVLKSRDPYMTPPEHLNYFTLPGMRNIFLRANLILGKKLTFGYLIDDEVDRVFDKYVSKTLSPIESFVKPLIPFGIYFLNIVKYGLEQEFYLTRKGR